MDVRVRALNEVSASLKNNIPFNSSSGFPDDFAFVDLHKLVHQLIKWFQIRPIWYEREVLDMLRLIFRVSCETFIFDSILTRSFRDEIFCDTS